MGDLEVLPALVAARWPGRELVVLGETGSTNDVAKERARAGAPPGLVVVADRQMAGRGRLGRVWHSPPGAGLYLSAIVPAPGVATRVPLAAAVAAARALGPWAPGLHVKWPNDVLAGDDRKLAGILCEATAGRVIVGIGVNVGHADFPAELAATAVSLRMLGATPDRAVVALALLDALDEWLPRADADWPAVRSAWCQASRTIGAHVRTAVDLDDDGALVVEALGHRHRVVSGDLA